MKLMFFLTMLFLMLPRTMALASLVEAGYTTSPTALGIKQNNVTQDGILIFSSEFDETLAFGNFTADEPAFATNSGMSQSCSARDYITEVWLSFDSVVFETISAALPTKGVSNRNRRSICRGKRESQRSPATASRVF